MPNAKFPSGSWDLFLETLFCFHWSYSWSGCFISNSNSAHVKKNFHVTVSAHLSCCNKKYFASVLWSSSHIISQFLYLLSQGLIEKLINSYYCMLQGCGYQGESFVEKSKFLVFPQGKKPIWSKLWRILNWLKMWIGKPDLLIDLISLVFLMIIILPVRRKCNWLFNGR